MRRASRFDSSEPVLGCTEMLSAESTALEGAEPNPQPNAQPVVRPTRQSAEPMAIGAILLAVLLLGGGTTGVKWSHNTGSVIAFWRLFFGMIVWQSVLIRNGFRWDRRSIKLTGSAGAIFGCNIAMFFTAATMTRIAHLEFIGAMAPVIVVPLAAFFLRERLPLFAIVAGVVALGGISLIIFGGSSSGRSTLHGDALAACGVTLWAGYLVYSAQIRRSIPASVLMAGMTTAATIVVLPVAVNNGIFHVTARGWLIVGLLAVANGVLAHFLISWAQQRAPVSTISLLLLGQPGLGTLWAYFVLGETVKPVQLAGMAVLLSAVGFIAVRSSRRK